MNGNTSDWSLNTIWPPQDTQQQSCCCIRLANGNASRCYRKQLVMAVIADHQPPASQTVWTVRPRWGIDWSTNERHKRAGEEEEEEREECVAAVVERLAPEFSSSLTVIATQNQFQNVVAIFYLLKHCKPRVLALSGNNKYLCAVNFNPCI